MKLSDKYIASQHKKQNNKLFQLFENELRHAFSNLPSRDRSREYVKGDRYVYELSNVEKEYHETFFTNFNDTIDTINPENNSNENILKIIEFIQSKKEGILLLIAPIGWGKTMLLGHIFHYMVPTGEEFKNIVPVYFFMDKHKNTLEVKTTAKIVKKLRKKIFPDQLRGLLKSYYDLDDEKLWAYIENYSDPFSKLAKKERNFRKRYADNPVKIQKKIWRTRDKAQDKNDFPFAVLKYIAAKQNSIPVIIFDNVDPLSIEINQIIFNEALRLHDDFQVKVIISIRKSTFMELANRPDGIIRANPPQEFWLPKPDVKRYLIHRVSIATNRIERKPIKVDPPDIPAIKFPDAKKVLLAMMNNILSSERVDVLDYLSYHNLRKVNSLVHKGLNS